jgi:Ca-activated chloride channel homolog
MNWGSHHILPWLLLFIPAAALFIWLHRRRRQRFSQLIKTSMWSKLAPDWRPERAAGKLFMWLLAMLFFGLALARPQWGFSWREVKQSGLDIVIVVDTSRSMLATDLRPNRLQQAKWGIRDMLGQLKGDRVGIVAFAGTSYLQSPLTSDYAALMMYVDDLNVGLVPRGGSAISDALRTAMKAFDPKSEADKIIVLISDGEDTVEDPLKLIPELKKNNIRVYAIGVGSAEGELIPIVEETGRETFLKDRSGNVVKTSLNENILTQLALSTGGAYVRASPGQFGIERLVQEEWSKLQQATGETRRLKMYEDRAGWFIGLGCLLLAIEALRSERRRKSSAS